MDAFSNGQVRSRRYRNRRLGEFLKELELTEGRATGIPTILKELRENGSPDPKFLTDDDYTCFEVELYIHPEFAPKTPMKLDLGAVQWDLRGIDKLIDQIILKAVGDIAGNQAGNQAEYSQVIGSQHIIILDLLGSNQADTIAGGIAGGIAEKQKTILEKCISAQSREEVLKTLKLSNQRKNYVEQMLPLVDLGWLTMTIPEKPTSPNQKYLTTLKGRLVLECLKHHMK
jgi:ATP-dependent DNA helicase RecG